MVLERYALSLAVAGRALGVGPPAEYDIISELYHDEAAAFGALAPSRLDGTPLAARLRELNARTTPRCGHSLHKSTSRSVGR